MTQKYTQMIQYVGQTAKVCCDGKCNKAWGISQRPKVQLSDDVDDYEFLADDELGNAPRFPGTIEGTDGKPASPKEFPNKWCVRECERCNMSQPGRFNEPLDVIKFDTRRKNISELLPCPFCGGIAEICYQRDDIGDWKVECKGCGAVSCPDGMRYDRQQAIDDWNKRIEQPLTA